MEPSEEHVRELKELELCLLDPGVRRSPERIAQLLADEFIEFGASGRVYDKRQCAEAIGGSANDQISLTEFEVRALAPNVALVTYRSAKRGSRRADQYALRSSIWKRTETGWKLVFHQGTPSAEPG